MLNLSITPHHNTASFLLFSACALLVFAAALPAAAQSSGSGEVTIPVTTSINGVRGQDTTVVLSAAGKLLKIDAKELLSNIRGESVMSVVDSITAASASSAMVPVAVAENAGLKIRFDEQSLTLVIAISPELQKVHVVDLNSAKVPASAEPVKPARFSAQLSLYGRVDAIDQYTSTAGSAVNFFAMPFSLTADPVINLYNWVLQSELAFDTSAPATLSLVDISLVKDVPGPDLRFTAGNLNYPVTGFLSNVPTVGIGVSRNFDLSLNKLFRPLGQMQFYLQRPSQVTVLVNGGPVKYLQLQPGPYNLLDFPLTPGMNNVQLKIQDDQGRTEYISGAYPFDSELLTPSVSAFSWNIGFPGWQIAPPVLSGFQSVGITPNYTMGGYVQADTISQIVGVQAVLATDIGTFGAGIAGSHDTTNGMDLGLSASYRFYDASRRNLPAVTLSAYYRGRYFIGPQSGLTEAPYRWLISAGISQALPRNFALNLGAGLQDTWSLGQFYNANLILSAPLTRSLSMSFVVGGNFSSNLMPSWHGQLTLIKTFPSSDGAMSYSQSLTSPTGQVGIDYRPASVPGFSVNAQVSGPPGVGGQTSGASATLTYQGNRFDTALGHSLSASDLTGTSSVLNHTYIRFDTALVYADGNAAITRPVSDSFAIMVRNKELGMALVGVNSTGTSYSAVSDFLGNAALSSIQSYTDTLANVQVPDAPIGYDLGDTLFLLSLPYRSGAVITIGTDATVYVGGTLEDGDGKPIVLLAGSLRSTGPAAKDHSFFTDAGGQFQVYGLKPGEYTLDMAGKGWKPKQISIPASATGLYDLGKVKLTRATGGN
ncbi:MAG TPA: hypothetical protein VMW73_00435 [Spirochaetia bacterium]|nr:hypothetical protein [Spirochaetia bacterium]